MTRIFLTLSMKSMFNTLHAISVPSCSILLIGLNN